LNTPLKQGIVSGNATIFVPDLIYLNGRFERGRALVCDGGGRVVAVAHLEEFGGRDEAVRRDVEAATSAFGAHGHVVRLRNRALLPGMVNAHSHAFQRVLRGRTEYLAAHARDSFWTWREMMYAASARLTPADLYDASRMAFLEMVLSGITSVGEFHYLHRTPEGAEYDDPNLLAGEVVRAARDTGLRVALLRAAYARAGFRVSADERQRRFIEPDAETYLRHTDSLARDLARDAPTSDASANRDDVGMRANREDVGVSADSEEIERQTVEDGVGARAFELPPHAWVGVAPHSVRAVPLEYLREVSAYAEARGLPLHMHVAEQLAEVAACVEETKRTPVALLSEEGVLGPRFTGVHAIHVTPEEVRALADARACVCACPTTERNLGDGVVPAAALFGAGVPIALGTDSQAQIDLLEDARELEYHLRLTSLRRNVLAPANADADRVESPGGGQDDAPAESDGSRASASDGSSVSALAARLFECATVSGARSIGAQSGEFIQGSAADFFTVDLNDPSIAGASVEDLLPAFVFSLSRAAVREVAVGGQLFVEGGRHAAQDEIVSRFAALQRRLWGR
jgi:formimidoylglutamate deiminase